MRLGSRSLAASCRMDIPVRLAKLHFGRGIGPDSKMKLKEAEVRLSMIYTSLNSTFPGLVVDSQACLDPLSPLRRAGMPILLLCCPGLRYL